MNTFYQWLETVAPQLRTCNIEDLLPARDDMEVAVDSLSKGRLAFDQGPIEVYQVGDKYVVANGHHRLLQTIIRGQAATVQIKVLPSATPMSTANTVPLDFYDGDYYGLDSSLRNGWLIKRLAV